MYEVKALLQTPDFDSRFMLLVVPAKTPLPMLVGSFSVSNWQLKCPENRTPVKSFLHKQACNANRYSTVWSKHLTP
jgi:hypothetical protein